MTSADFSTPPRLLGAMETSPDILYTFSDLFQTQLGGPKGKKFMIKHFRDLIVEAIAKPFEEQKEFLNHAIEEWIGAGEQTDDVCVIGVRVGCI